MNLKASTSAAPIAPEATATSTPAVAATVAAAVSTNDENSAPTVATPPSIKGKRFGEPAATDSEPVVTLDDPHDQATVEAKKKKNRNIVCVGDAACMMCSS